MCITEGVDEISRFQAAHLRHHQGEQGVAGDVERYAQKNIRAALIKLAGELAVGDVKLKEGMARREFHFVEFANVPRRNDNTARIRIIFNLIDSDFYLVDH